MFDFLPRQVINALRLLGNIEVYEIRLRIEMPTVIDCSLGVGYLSSIGYTLNADDGIKITAMQMDSLFFNLCERSVYAHIEQIKQGFVTLNNGVRVGICGECVVEAGHITNIKNITSINVRIPHEVKGCSSSIFKLMNNGLKNLLIVAPVGAGKTTFVRDIAGEISSRYLKPVLVVDERNEIFPLMSNGYNVDCIKYAPKAFAFENGIRAMAPQVIVTDEISGKADCLALKRAVDSGVCVVATAHGSSLENIVSQKEFALIRQIFDYYVLLNGEKRKGEIAAIFDKDLNKIVC